MTDPFVLTLSCPNRAGIVQAVSSHLGAYGCDIVEHQQFDDPVSGRLFMRTAGVDRRRARHAGRGLRRRRRRVRDGVRVPPAPRRAGAGHGVEVGTLPERPDLPLAHRQPRRRPGGRRVQPRGPARHGRDRRPAVLPRARLPGDQGGRRGPAARARRRPRRRARRARPLHADPVRPDLRGPARAGDQHPPLVPARLRGRQALPPGLRPRGEARRGDRALRHPGPRRGADHRAGGDPDRPLLRPRGPADGGRDAEALALSRAVRWHCQRRVLVDGHRTVVFRWRGCSAS